MTQPHVIIEVSVEGELTIKPVGFIGTSCLQATKALEQALGTANEDDRTLTPEYYASAEVEQAQTVIQ